MLHLTESASGLVLSYPLWLGATSFIAGAGLLGYAARPRAAVKKRWGVLVVSGMLICVGIYLGSFRVTLTPESGRIYAFLAEDTRMNWSDAGSASVVRRYKGKGGPREYMVVRDGALRELEIPLESLTDAERQRVIRYVYSKMPR